MASESAAVARLVLPAKRQRRAARRVAPRTISAARRWLTLGMGCGIPGLSLALSSIGGRLATEGLPWHGGAALGLCCGVLAVSLSHLAWAIRDITGSARWQAWCLAGAIDAGLVLGELAGVAGFAFWAVPVLMWAVAVTSAALNGWAFLGHKRR
jgi:hypothetical protein